MTLAQDFQAPLIDSTIGQYNSAGMNNSSLWLAFLASLQQGRALERTFVLFTSTHCHAYRKYWKTGKLEASEIYRLSACTLEDLIFADVC